MAAHAIFDQQSSPHDLALLAFTACSILPQTDFIFATRCAARSQDSDACSSSGNASIQCIVSGVDARQIMRLICPY